MLVSVKVKAHTLREKSKSDLLKQLDELKLELSQVNYISYLM
jgi:ribosomal protein L29